MRKAIPQKLTLLYSASEIEERIQQVAEAINRDYRGRGILLVGVLKGALVFLADLMRLLDLELTVDFLGLSSYGMGRRSSHKIAVTKVLSLSVAGKHVLLVEDILDTGLTTAFALDYLRTLQPASLSTCVLLDKLEGRQVEVEVDYLGFRFEEGFVVGYGIDYAERFRNLPDIYLLEPEDPLQETMPTEAG